MTFYNILGIVPTANEVDIRSAYIKQALKWHPDRCDSPDAEEKFKAVAEAYFVLGDKKRRSSYDSSLKSKRDYNIGQVSVDAVFGSVFDDLLKPEMTGGNNSVFYRPVGTIAGAILGGIILNVPGLIAGAYFGSKMGQIRDRNGMSVYDSFVQLPPNRR